MHVQAVNKTLPTGDQEEKGQTVHASEPGASLYFPVHKQSKSHAHIYAAIHVQICMCSQHYLVFVNDVVVKGTEVLFVCAYGGVKVCVGAYVCTCVYVE